MSIQATQNCNNVFEFCSNYLIDFKESEIWDSKTQTIKQGHPKAGITGTVAFTNKTNLKIPAFQRGIEWQFDTLLECISSKSPMLGTVVLGQVVSAPNDFHILDGLQRFSAFTFLLHEINDFLFDRADPSNPNPWGLHQSVVTSQDFIDLQNGAAQYSGYRRSISYNFELLLIHRRKIISKSFEAWIKNSSNRLKSLRDPTHGDFSVTDSQEFISNLKLFLFKPLYVSSITQFTNWSQLISAFIAINTVRVELTPADVCRSILVGIYQTSGATTDDAADMEEIFNEALLFTDGRVKTGFSPLIKVIDADWRDEVGAIVPALFASPNKQSIETEMFEFCDWITFFSGLSNPYLSLLKTIGDNPFIASMMFFYHKRSKDQNGNFIEPNTSDLHKLAVTYLRKLLDGGVGDTLPTTKLVAKRPTMTLNEFIESISPSRSGQPLQRTERQWLINCLDGVKAASTAKIIFQACLLPPIHGAASFGDPLEQMNFYRGQNNWTLDHLIPQNSFAPPRSHSAGDGFKDSLRNYCPIKGTDNSSYRAKDCALKLNDATAISTYLTDPNKLIAGSPHPFISALISRQGNTNDVDLNNREYLATHSPSRRCYGEERLEILCDLLVVRI